jgi:hypothetical protein
MRLLSAILVFACAAGGRSYYVDCASGSDAATAASETAAWKTLQKVSATTFAPGDAILLKRGIRCAGPLWPKGSGEAGRPIRVDAYGEGPLPAIDAGKGDAALKLSDQQQWEIENVELSGGEPYGIWITASSRMRHFVLRNLVVHNVGGAVKKKASGLVVLAGALDDVLVDGVTAFQTSQWAGIYISGSRRERARNVVVRNSIVHDVEGDGIVLFNAENGRIEKSAAWRTGLQERETIGTPNGIWTWTCRNCVVENTEGFWIDSPGVDGGVYDIDWGNEDNTVQLNYAHDAQGYCAAIFGAGKLVTTNSVIRNNVCVNNGRSPKLARRQGDIYTSTWGGGALDGIRIEGNTIVWNPPIDAPAVQMSGTKFSGSRPNVVAENVVYSAVSSLVRGAAPVNFERNIYWRPGGAAGQWSYGDGDYLGIERWREIAPTDLFRKPQAAQPRAAVSSPGSLPLAGKWTLVLFAGKRDPGARSQLVFIQAALAQFPELDALVSADADANFQYDWNLGAVRRFQAERTGAAPILLLIDPAGKAARAWDGFAPPAELGVELKRRLGAAPSNSPIGIEGFLP